MNMCLPATGKEATIGMTVAQYDETRFGVQMKDLSERPRIFVIYNPGHV
jgi:hypothetical protein